MIVSIKCRICQEVMGQIEKEVVSEQDVAEYQQMLTCSQGHTDVRLEEGNGDQEN